MGTSVLFTTQQAADVIAFNSSSVTIRFRRLHPERWRRQKVATSILWHRTRA
jgi:hypothetical protein